MGDSERIRKRLAILNGLSKSAEPDPVPVTPGQREDMEQQFVIEYLSNGMVGTRAAIAAGYSERSARTIAYRLLRKPEIEGQIKEAVNVRLKAARC